MTKREGTMLSEGVDLTGSICTAAGDLQLGPNFLERRGARSIRSCYAWSVFDSPADSGILRVVPILPQFALLQIQKETR